MKKQILLMFALLIAVTQAMAFVVTPGVVTVGATGDYTDLQTAITNAATGDEIHILDPGTYNGVVLNSAKNLKVLNQSSGTVTVQGASPALTVSAGFISFNGVNFITATNDPAILITGGKLELRNSVITEAPAYNQSGIFISGGELDAGTLTTPGHNSFVVSGAGKALVNNGGIANAIRNYWGSDFYMDIAPLINGTVAWDPWCNATFTNCNLSVYGGPITTIPKIIMPCGPATTVNIPVYADQFANIDAISLTIDYWPGTLQYTGYTADVAFPGMSVIANNTTGKAIIGWFGPVVATFPNNVPMVVLQFTYNGGSSYLNFNDANIVDCEYQNALIQYPYADEIYNDGWITDLGGMVLGSTNVICYGTQSGTISVTGASCGSGAYEYSIDGGATWQSTNTYNVYAGTYNVWIRDANFPTVKIQLNPALVIAQPAAPFSLTAYWTKRVRCKGESNGEATAFPVGGWGGYTYKWSDPLAQTTKTAIGLAAGWYSVTVTDAGGCSITLPVNVIEPLHPFQASVTPIPVSCKGSATGGFTINAANGWGYYMYSIDMINYWSYLTSNTVTGLPAGTYTVHIFDDERCEIFLPLTIPEPAVALTGAAVVTQNVSCYGFADGIITASANGGWSGYQYSINGGTTWQPSPVFNGLVAGTYTVLVKDLYNCIITLPSLVVTQPPYFGTVISGTNTICYGFSTQLTFNSTGGVAPYTMVYTDGTTNFTVNSIPSFPVVISVSPAATTNYTLVSVTDANGCPSLLSGNALITVNPLPQIGFSFNGNLAGTGSVFNYCYNETVIVAMTHNWVGTAPYNISWTVDDGSGPVTSSATGVNVPDVLFSSLLAPGTYVVQITSIVDANGCSPASYAPYTATAVVHPEPAVGFSFNGQLAVTGSTFEYCYNETVTVALTHNWVGTAPYQIAWTVNGVPASASVVNLNDVLFSSILAPNTYNVQITSIVDANGCSPASYAPYTATVIVNQEPIISFGFNNVEAGHNATFQYCYDEQIGVTLFAQYGGIAPYTVTYEVNGVTSTVSGLYVGGIISPAQIYNPGTYNIVVTGITDAKGCKASAAFLALCHATIIVHEEPMVSFGFNGVEAGHNASFVYCYNEPIGVTLFASYGGTAPYSVTYTVNGGSPVTVTGLNVGSTIIAPQLYAPNVYTIAVTNITDANGCEASAAFLTLCQATVTVNPEPIISFGFNGVEAGHNASFQYCYNETVGVTLFAQYQGTAPYSVTYTINGGTPVTVNNLNVGDFVVAPQIYTPGVYVVQVTDITDAKGCKSSPAFLALCNATITIHDEPMVSFGFNGVEAGHNATFEYCYDVPVGVTLFAEYGGTAPYTVTYEVNGVTNTVTGLYVGGTIIAPQLYTAGVYNIKVTDITDVYGCKASPAFLALCQAIVTINPEPAVGFSFNGVLAATGSIFDYCYTTPVNVTLSHIWAGYAPFTVTYTVDDGTGPVTSTVSGLNLNGTLFSGLLTPGSYIIKVIGIVDAKGCSPANYQPYTATVKIHKVDLDGYYTYHNSASTPLNNITVNITGPAGNYTTVTDAVGYYKFQNICPGTYEVISTTIKPVGSINSTDAVQVNAWGVNYASNPIEKVRFKAGDVAPNYGFMDMGDAISILMYFTNGGTPAFNPNWVFWFANDVTTSNPEVITGNPFITLGYTNLSQDFFGMVSADFNRSFIPGNAKLGNTMILNHKGSVLVEKSQELVIPVTVESAMSITAASLILNYPADKLEILAVEMKGTNAPVLFNAVNGVLRIAYADVNPITYTAGDILLTLKVRTTQNLLNGELIRITMSTDPLNELADATFEPIASAELNIPVLEFTTGINNTPAEGVITLSNRPNPFNGTTTLNYLIPAEGKVEIALYDLYGRMISVIENNRMNAGQHNTQLDISHLNSGVYMVVLKFSDGSSEQVRTLRIINQH